MKIGIMQPYFFPYIGYFQLINIVDRFILFDDVQYIRHGWINRNRILKPAQGHQFINMPLRNHSSKAEIKNIRTTDDDKWKIKILRQLEHYKKSAPFYFQVRSLLEQCFEFNNPNITIINGHCLKLICKYIGIEYNVEVSSSMGFNYSDVSHAGEWALRISEQCNANEYINPVGGIVLFDKAQFEKSNITLRFINPIAEEYCQRRDNFEPWLSIIDILMFNSPGKVHEMLDAYELS